jgi:hypothetical protein
MSVRDWFELFAFTAQIVTFPIVGCSIWLARIQANAGRDLQIALQLAESFRARWETDWRKALSEVTRAQKAAGNDLVPAELAEKIHNMLNWVDWVGNLIRTRLLTNPVVVLGSIEPQLAEIIRAGRSVVVEDLRKEGAAYWSGVVEVAKRLNIPLASSA